MQFEDILYEGRDGVAWITINRPTVRNAFRAKTVDEMVAALRAAWADPEIGVVVLTGASCHRASAQRMNSTCTPGGAGEVASMKTSPSSERPGSTL